MNRFIALVLGRDDKFAAARWALLLVTTGLLLVAARPAHAASTDENPPLCRFGVNVHVTKGVSGVSDFDVASLRAGTYIDYRSLAAPAQPNGMRYIPVVRLSQMQDGFEYTPSGQALEEMVLGNPGAPVYIGNEPDRRVYQDDIEPDVYATAYHDLYALIKSIDPTMQIFPASIVQATELRLKYLDLVLDAYKEQYGRPMPVDGWSIHGFILNEKRGEWGADIPPGLDDDAGMVINVQETDDVDIFTANIERFRQWMYDNGYRDKPLYLSEYGSLMPNLDYLCGPDGTQCFTEARVNVFMNATFDYLLAAADPDIGYTPDNNRLVQHASWYSTNDKGFNGYLFDVDDGKALSTMGRNYAAYTEAIDDEVDFRVVKLTITPPAPSVSGGPVNLKLSAEVANSGNLQIGTQATVTFYQCDPDDGGVALGPAQAVELAGCGARKTVSFTWENVDSSLNGERVYAVVVVDDETDADPSNNVATQTVFFAKAYIFLPHID